MTTKVTDYFIWYKDDVIPLDFCNHIIEKFKKDPNKSLGAIKFGEVVDIKKSTDLWINKHEDWQEEIEFLTQINMKCFGQYNDHVHEIDLPTDDGYTKASPFIFPSIPNTTIQDSGHNIQETKPTEGYSWHSDWLCEGGGIRYLTYIHYLNTVDEGWTQFYNGSQIEPKAGRVLFFPSSWQMIHRGFPPKQTKYINTGWISQISNP